MNATVSMDALYTFLKSLSLGSDNERWLAEKLYEDIEEQEKQLAPYTMEELDARVYTTEEVKRMMESKYPCLCE